MGDLGKLWGGLLQILFYSLSEGEAQKKRVQLKNIDIEYYMAQYDINKWEFPPT